MVVSISHDYIYNIAVSLQNNSSKPTAISYMRQLQQALM